MKERLLGFIFFAILLGFGVNAAIDGIHARYFSQSLAYQSHWYVFFIVIPAVALLGLAWLFGFFRPRGERLGDALALATIAAIVYLMLGAAHSCWQHCF